MQLGIIGDWNDEGFAYVTKLGLSNIEFNVNVDIDAYEFAARSGEIFGYTKKYGVHVCSIGRFGTERILKDGRVNEDEYNSDIAMIGACSKIGSPVYVCGVNAVPDKSFEENVEIAVSYLLKLTAYAKERNVRLLLYNCDWGNFIHSPKGWDAVLPRVPGLGIKYDPSHCYERGNDPLAELRDYGKYVGHFHVKGSIYIGGKRFDNPPAGLDLTPWGAIMDMLYACNYNGVLSIEPHSHIWSGLRGEWGVRFTIDYISKFIMPENYETVSNKQSTP